MSDQAKQAERQIELYSAVGGSPRIFKLQLEDAFGIEVGGVVCIKPLAEWHRLAINDAPPFEYRKDDDTGATLRFHREDRAAVSHEAPRTESVDVYDKELGGWKTIRRPVAPSSIAPFDLKDTLHKVVNNLLEHGGQHYKRMFGREGSCVFTNAEVGALREVVYRALEAQKASLSATRQTIPLQRSEPKGCPTPGACSCPGSINV